MICMQANFLRYSRMQENLTGIKGLWLLTLFIRIELMSTLRGERRNVLADGAEVLFKVERDRPLSLGFLE